MKKLFVYSLIVLVLSGQITTAFAFNINDNRQKLQLEVDKLNKEITKTQEEIDSITVNLEWLTKQIIITYQKLDLAKKELKKKEAGFNKRLGEVYKNYYDFLVFFVLDSPNFNSLWDRFAFLAKVNAADREMLAQQKRQVKEVRKLKKELIYKKKLQLNLKKAKLVHLLELQKLKLQKQALMASLPVAD